MLFPVLYVDSTVLDAVAACDDPAVVVAVVVVIAAGYADVMVAVDLLQHSDTAQKMIHYIVSLDTVGKKCFLLHVPVSPVPSSPTNTTPFRVFLLSSNNNNSNTEFLLSASPSCTGHGTSQKQEYLKQKSSSGEGTLVGH